MFGVLCLNTKTEHWFKQQGTFSSVIWWGVNQCCCKPFVGSQKSVLNICRLFILFAPPSIFITHGAAHLAMVVNAILAFLNIICCIFSRIYIKNLNWTQEKKQTQPLDLGLCSLLSVWNSLHIIKNRGYIMFLSLSQQLVYLWNVYNVQCSSSCDEKLTGNACIDLCFKIITFHNSKDNNGEDCFLLSRASSSLPYIQKVKCLQRLLFTEKFSLT